MSALLGVLIECGKTIRFSEASAIARTVDRASTVLSIMGKPTKYMWISPGWGLHQTTSLPLRLVNAREWEKG